MDLKYTHQIIRENRQSPYFAGGVEIIRKVLRYVNI